MKTKCILSCGRHKLHPTNYDVSPRVELTINAHTRITVTLLCTLHTWLVQVSPYLAWEKEGKLFNFFFYFFFEFLALAVASCKQKHMSCDSFLLWRSKLCFIVRLENKILDIQAAIFILILGLATPTAFNEQRAKQNYEENININMCEHEQNFHALDVVFYSFLLFSCAIGRSYLVFCIFCCCFYSLPSIIRCSCLKRATDTSTTQGFLFVIESKLLSLFASRLCIYVNFGCLFVARSIGWQLGKNFFCTFWGFWIKSKIISFRSIERWRSQKFCLFKMSI